jgi:hypothetical protein
VNVFDHTVPVSASDVEKVLASMPQRSASGPTAVSMGQAPKAAMARPAAGAEPTGAPRKDEITGKGIARPAQATPPVAAPSVPPDKPFLSKNPSGSGAHKSLPKTPSGSGAHARALLGQTGGKAAIDKSSKRPAPTPPLRQSMPDDDEVDAPAVFKLERSGGQEVLGVKQVGAMGSGAHKAAHAGTIDGMTTTGASLRTRSKRRTMLAAGAGAVALAVVALVASVGRSGADRPANAGAPGPAAAASPPQPVQNGEDAGGRLDPKLQRMAP